ncbi:MAG: FAD binding domain-containing protein [Ignavibacteriaceae bacterium]|nr:FAD binding domain-containing protein [Ignavibacteriaceae bacterium]
MMSHDLQWYYPEKISEALKLIQKEGVILHAGGTRILKTEPRNLKGFVDISHLKLNYIKKEVKNIIIGAGCTLSDVINYCKKTNSLDGLCMALAETASTPLRNRITIGGSLKDFPVWSSLYSPLIALDAKLELAGVKELCSLEDYVKKNIIKSKHIIKQVVIKDDKDIICRVMRFNLVRFEYPIFNVAVALKVKDKVVMDSRIVITGVKGRFHRFKQSEKVLNGSTLTDEVIAKSTEYFVPKFHHDYKYSPEYREHIAKVYFNDIVKELKEDMK